MSAFRVGWVGGRGGTQLIDYKNKAFVYLYLECLLPLRYGAFYMQPGGSSLDPLPDLRRLRRAPGRGRLGFEVFCRAGRACFVCVCVLSVFVCGCVFVCVRVCVCLCVCLCFIGCVLGCLCLVVLVVSTCGGLCGNLKGLVVSLWHFGWPWGSIVAHWASTLTLMGYSSKSFGHFGGTLGLHFGSLGLYLGTLGSMLVSCGHFGVWTLIPRASFVEKTPKRHPKCMHKWRHFQ